METPIWAFYTVSPDSPERRVPRRYPRMELHQATAASFCSGNVSASRDHDPQADAGRKPLWERAVVGIFPMKMDDLMGFYGAHKWWFHGV